MAPDEFGRVMLREQVRGILNSRTFDDVQFVVLHFLLNSKKLRCNVPQFSKALTLYDAKGCRCIR